MKDKTKDYKRLLAFIKQLIFYEERQSGHRVSNYTFELIQTAIEKQIPQEPLYVDNAFPECCPRCYEAIESNKDNFCSKCGQALKWG